MSEPRHHDGVAAAHYMDKGGGSNEHGQITDMMSTPRCGRVEPFWVRLGSVQWQGHPEKEPLMNIEYRRCPRGVHRLVTTPDGFEFPLCIEHAAPRSADGENR